MRWLLFLVLLSSFVLAQPIIICNGCPYNERCVSYASQINSPSGKLYCSEDSTMNPAKPDSMPCSKNYECLSFFCSDGMCGNAAEPIYITSSNGTKTSFLFPSIIIGSLLSLALLLLLVKYLLKHPTSKKAKPSSKKNENFVPSVVKILPVKRKYSQFQKLDKQLEESTKKLTHK